MKKQNFYASGGLADIGSYEGTFGQSYDPNNLYTYGQAGFTGRDFGNSAVGNQSAITSQAKANSGLISNTYKPKLGIDIWNSLSPAAQKYYIKKGSFGPNAVGLTDPKSPDHNMSQERFLSIVNDVMRAKGATPVTSASQIEAATAPLIAQRNKRGMGGALGMIAPIALSFLAPGIGTALGTALGIGSTAATALAGVGLGALGPGITGGNPLLGAALGGAVS